MHVSTRLLSAWDTNRTRRAMWRRLGACAIASFAALGVRVAAQTPTPTILLDDFESGEIRIVNPDWSTPQGRLLWNQYQDDFTEGPDPGVESVTSETAHDGTHSLKVTVAAGNLYLQFYPYDGIWRNMRDFVQPAADWQTNTFNRLRFWIKVPRGVETAGAGQANGYVGTYIRKSGGNPRSAEDGGNHYYHSFNLPYTGEWHQVILDTHPTHRRGDGGGVEPGNQEYPTAESQFNYFDALTRFYVDFVGRLRGYPADFYFDGFEAFRANKLENIDQIHTLNAVYLPSINKLHVGWMRHKDQNAVKHEVRYSFEDVLTIGWDNAMPAPSGLVAPLGWQGYNGMDWSTDELDLSGQSTIYIAIKPEGSDLFRQIAIPLTSGAGPGPRTTPASARQ